MLAFIGMALRSKRPRLGAFLLWTGLGLLLLLSLPLIVYWMEGALTDARPLDFAAAREAQAIVVLSAGIRTDALEYGGDTVSQLSLERTRYGAWVAKRTGLPVLVSGGIVFEGNAEAEIMRQTMEKEFAVPVRWVEATSRTTHENAVHSAALLRAQGVERVVLVTHGLHMARAQAEFEAAGLKVVPAPTGIHNRDAEKTPLIWWLVPSVSALRTSTYLIYETLGDLARRIGL